MVVLVLFKIKFGHAWKCAQNRYTNVENSLYQPLANQALFYSWNEESFQHKLDMIGDLLQCQNP